MAWDSSRPVPWARLTREWAIFVAIMAAVFALAFRDDATVGTFAGLIVSGPVYLLFGAVLAKFGYQRKSLRDLRAERTAAQARKAAAPTAPAPRQRPAPTRRTSTGPQHRRKQRR